MIGEAHRWPESIDQADRCLLAASSLDQSSTFDFHDADCWQDGLTRQLSSFLDSNFGSGFVLVKTSTTGRRSPDHEVSTEVLGLVLDKVAKKIGGKNVLLADGPVYATTSYYEESRRLGWETIAKNLKVEIADLNEDSSIDLIPKWPVAKHFLKADAIILLSKAKTHRRFGASLSGKSLIGALPGKSYGYPKLRGFHHFVPWLISVLEKHSPPLFSVIDGYRGIEGEGPWQGAPTRSHFLVMGSGTTGPDVRTVIEMGFDPPLVPSFIRPFALEPTECPSWAQYRLTDVDFLPARSCHWLYQSLQKSKRRNRIYRTLLKGAQECWPSTG